VQRLDLRSGHRWRRGCDDRVVELTLTRLLVDRLRVGHEPDGDGVQASERAGRRVTDQRARLLESRGLLELPEQRAARLERARDLTPRAEHHCPTDERQQHEEDQYGLREATRVSNQLCRRRRHGAAHLK
jgi:hypothetical protein